MTDSRSANRNAEGRGAQRPVGRKLAEWVTLGISSAIVFGLAGYLIVQAARPESPYLSTTTRVRLDQVHEANGTYILPVEVRNTGRRTARDLTIQITAPGVDQEVTLDFLGERSSETIYAYLDRDPRKLDVKAEPRSYLVD